MERQTGIARTPTCSDTQAEAARVAYWSNTWRLPPERIRERVEELGLDAVKDALADIGPAGDIGRRH